VLSSFTFSLVFPVQAPEQGRVQVPPVRVAEVEAASPLAAA